MANLIPPTIPESAPNSEKKLYKAFAALGDDWTILHSVKWQSKRHGRQGDGEADFLLLHKDCGILVLEVKGGGISIQNGQWFTTDRHNETHPIKDPYGQAQDSKHALLSYLSEHGFPRQVVPINHAVAFPDITVDQSLGPAAAPQLTWDAPKLTQMARTLATTISHWKPQASLDNKDIGKLTHLLAPTINIRRRLCDEVADVEKRLIMLTEGQIKTFGQIRKIREALILGSAGTGKTILAVERALKLHEDGFRVLFTCYNELLCRRIREELPPEIDVLTYHALCMREMGKARIKAPYTKDPAWWDDAAPQLLIEASALNNTSYDSIIIDEGQDFSQEWISSLQLLGKDANDPPIYVFADMYQRLYRRYWEAPSTWMVYELDTNCRNTHPIAERVSAIFEHKIKVLGADGPKPNFIELNPKEAAVITEKVVTRLLEVEGLAPTQICVLSNDANLVSNLMEKNAGAYPFVPFGSKGIVVETVARFKGLEADVVVLVLLNTGKEPEKDKAMIYTGMSRAKGVLLVLGQISDKKAANWN